MRRPFIAIILLLWPAVLLAQGSQADYDRAAHLRRSTAEKVFRESISIHWLPDGLWYRVATGPRQHEFVRAKFADGRRALAFNHDHLAEALGWEQIGAARRSTTCVGKI